MIDAPTLDRLMELPATERLALAEQLWNSLIADPAAVPVPDWHRDLLAERLEEDDADPTAVESWADVRARIERKP